MQKYKIIFIDIDGTLRNNKKEVTPYTAKVIKQAVDAGLIIVICSARYRKYTQDVSIESNASPYIISSNGADIYNYKTNETIFNKNIDKNVLKKLYDIVVKYDAFIGLDTDGDRFVNKIRHPEREVIIDDLDNILNSYSITQCVLHSPDSEKVRHMIDEVKNLNEPQIEIKNTTKYLTEPVGDPPPNFFCDVGNSTTTKGTGITYLLNYLNIPKEESIAIGDGLNDLLMFDSVGYKVAMGNSISQVLNAADEVTLSNEEDGVAKFIEKLINK